MELKKLVTLTFERNVATWDRILRLTSGAGMVTAGLYLPISRWPAVAMATFGVMWMATGVLSKCSIYYLLGYSTCPLETLPADRRE